MYIYFIIICLLYNHMAFKIFVSSEKVVENLIQLELALDDEEQIPPDMKDRQDRINEVAVNILSHYTILKIGINSSIKFEADSLRNIAINSTHLDDNSFLHELNEFVKLIISTEHPDNPSAFGLLNMYSNYTHIKEAQHRWCDNEQSASHFIYKSLRFILDILNKGYWVLLQSYQIHKALGGGKFAAEMKDLQGKYKDAITRAMLNANSLITDTSTRIRRCDPPQQIRGETYLEMEKLLQGIVVHELTLSPNNTINWPCSDYHGVSYYPRKSIWSGGDWKCHGKMYDCFKSYLKILCKPSTPNRRIDGFTAENLKFPGFRDGALLDMGNVTNCYINKLWTKEDWAYLDEFTFYEDKECACICDDFQHPKTLRSFSSQNVVTDYRNNMVMTGIRLINISNVIHFDIQQGKLEKFGFINSSTVHWRSRSEMENENVASSWEPITLNYGMRGLYLDTIHVESSEAIIGVRFQWDLSKENVALAVLVGKVDFPNGQVLPTIDRWLSKDWFGDIRTEVILDKPHMPTLCYRNIPMREDNKFIRFQTTDWVKDAAQSTIPYLDIQAVATNPPSLIGGIGLNYRHASECGGYIAVELYSFNYSEWITKIPIPTVAIKRRFNFK